MQTSNNRHLEQRQLHSKISISILTRFIFRLETAQFITKLRNKMSTAIGEASNINFWTSHRRKNISKNRD